MQPHDGAQIGLAASEKAWLLKVAREAVVSAVNRERLPEPANPGGSLGSSAGIFVTLRIEQQLRGCIGQMSGREPLYRAVVSAAEASALRDPRFPPLSREEVPLLEIEISVLSPAVELDAAVIEQTIRVGQHGLVVSRENRRGLLLPQVALHYGWDTREFLEQTCLKAGLARDAWRHGARLEIFTAEVFGERKALAAYSNST